MVGENFFKEVPFSESNAPCGGPTVLEINTEISLSSPKNGSQGYAEIDTVCHYLPLSGSDC